MCMTTWGEPKIEIAKRNIICYKNLNGSTSECSYWKYELGVTNPTVEFGISEPDRGNRYSINQGYHSRTNSVIYSKQHNNCIFMIPKGAKYIKGSESSLKNKNDNYVSETIIYIGKNTRWNRIKAKFKTYVSNNK